MTECSLPSLPTRFGRRAKRMQREPLCPFLAYLHERRLCLWEPQRHLHGAVERDGGGQGGAPVPSGRWWHTGYQGPGDSDA